MEKNSISQNATDCYDDVRLLLEDMHTLWQNGSTTEIEDFKSYLKGIVNELRKQKII